jgi:hypothetical protein
VCGDAGPDRCNNDLGMTSFDLLGESQPEVSTLGVVNPKNKGSDATWRRLPVIPATSDRRWRTPPLLLLFYANPGVGVRDVEGGRRVGGEDTWWRRLGLGGGEEVSGEFGRGIASMREKGPMVGEKILGRRCGEGGDAWAAAYVGKEMLGRLRQGFGIAAQPVQN